MSATRRLLETVADIAYLAGGKMHYSGDSRADVSTYISWAHEFEKRRRVDESGEEKYDGTDYMSAVENFTLRKLQESGQCSAPTTRRPK